MANDEKRFEIKEIETDVIKCRLIRNGSVVAMAIQDMDELFRASHGVMNVYIATNGWEVVSKKRPRLYWWQVGLRGSERNFDDDICSYWCGDNEQVAQEFMQGVIDAILEWVDNWREDRLEFIRRRECQTGT